MDAAMQRMNDILQRVHHEPPNTATPIPAAFTEVEKVTKESTLHEVAEFVSEVDGSLTTLQDENIDQSNEEVKRHMEEASVEVPSDPFFVEWPWISVVFNSSWGQWIIGSDEQ